MKCSWLEPADVVFGDVMNSLGVESPVDGVHTRWEGKRRESIYFFFAVLCLRVERSLRNTPILTPLFLRSLLFFPSRVC